MAVRPDQGQSALAAHQWGGNRRNSSRLGIRSRLLAAWSRRFQGGSVFVAHCSLPRSGQEVDSYEHRHPDEDLFSCVRSHRVWIRAKVKGGRGHVSIEQRAYTDHGGPSGAQGEQGQRSPNHGPIEVVALVQPHRSRAPDH
jgi:hypothetical protein